FQQRRVDELRVFRPRDPHERPDQDVVDLLGGEEAEDEGYAEAEQRLDQPRAQLDQVVHQWRLAGLDIGVGHDALASLSASGGAVSPVAGAGSTSRVMASGSSCAAACVSASTKVSGAGASGVVGVAGGSIAATDEVSAALLASSM